MHEAADHIRAFINSFVEARRRSGWTNALFERPEKATDQLRKFERHNDPRFCKLVKSPDEALRGLSASLGVQDVVYLDSEEGARTLGTEEALRLWTHECGDAIASVIPGRSAVFLFHEGWGWLCRRA